MNRRNRIKVERELLEKEPKLLTERRRVEIVKKTCDRISKHKYFVKNELKVGVQDLMYRMEVIYIYIYISFFLSMWVCVSMCVCITILYI